MTRRSCLANVIRDRVESEVEIIRKRDPALAESLNCPVLSSSPEALRLRPGSDLAASRGLEAILQRGWSFPEPWGVWSIGAKAGLRVPFDRSTTFPIKLEVTLQAFTRPGLNQSVAISVNGRPAAMLQFGQSSGECVHTIEISGDEVSRDFSATVLFDISHPTAPADIDGSADRRKLGIGIRRLRIL
jgi:hypothetical protein